MNLTRLVHESKTVPTLAILVMAQCVDRMVYPQILYDRTKFFVYFASILLPIASLAASGAIAIYYKVYAKVYAKDKSAGSTPADTTPRLPHYRYILMALFSTLYNLLSIAPTPHIGGYYTAVSLSELSLPFTIALSYTVLSMSFKHGHELGLLLVLYGSLVAMAPKVDEDQSPDQRSHSDWSRLYSISTMQQALLATSVFKQLGLQLEDVGFYITNPWISIYQILLGLASLCFLNAAPLLSWSDLLSLVCEMCDHVLDKRFTCDWSIFGWFMVAAICHILISNCPVSALNGGSKMLVDTVTFATGLPMTYIIYSLPAMAVACSNDAGLVTVFDWIVLFGFFFTSVWLRIAAMQVKL